MFIPLDKRITFGQLLDRLNEYRDKYENHELITIGCSSDHFWNFIVSEDYHNTFGRNEIKLSIPQYQKEYNEKE